MAKVFVFGSNLAGRHGAGSALEALKHGAIYGRGFGRIGNSFAIPTKDKNLKVLPLKQIEFYVETFKKHAQQKPDDIFECVAVGCGLAGYSPEQIGPLFKGCPNNVKLPREFLPYVN